jgi:hypothetical protein
VAYVRLESTQVYNSIPVDGIQYSTIVNGQSINITIKKYYDKLTADQIKTFDELATNVYFLEITEKPVAYKEDLISKILGGALSGMVLAAIVLAVRSIRNRRKKKNEYRW